MNNIAKSLFRLGRAVNLRRSLPAVAATALLASALLGFQARAEAGAKPPFIPLKAKMGGHSYSEWSAAWWEWALSMPADQHPLFDTAAADAGQSGKVWFLGGTFASDEIERTASIPKGKALFFPIINMECSTLDLPRATEEDLLACASALADLVDPSSLFVVIDGKSIPNPELFRFVSPLFEIGPLPDNNILAAPPGSTASAVSDGYFLMLPPLSVGTHTVRFGGIADFGAGRVFVQDIVYTITVGPAGRR